MHTKNIAVIVTIILVATIAMWYIGSTMMDTEEVPGPGVVEEVSAPTLDPVIQAHIAEKADLIVLASPQPLDTITSPLTLTGEARGYWFFEASFPIYVINWDGLIIAEGYATATGDWMTEDFVPFTATITFTSPYQSGNPDFMQRGTLILKKDNPSDLPEFDDALELPIFFE